MKRVSLLNVNQLRAGDIFRSVASWKVVGISCDAISSNMKLHDCGLTFKINVAPRKRAVGGSLVRFSRGGL
jgi:hypothetical protein